MRPRVSIIVPIFNVEKYLSRCLDSLLLQTLEDIEIVAVNDGSTDSSFEILEQYAMKDNRIKVIDKLNGGVSSARNEGLKLAMGDYIGFVDPDDWVDREMYEVMYNHAANREYEIVMCSYIREFENHSKKKNFDLPKEISLENEDVNVNFMRRLVGPLNDEIANPELLDAWGTVWSKLYKAELIKKNGIKFTDLDKIGTNEDTLFNIEASYYAKSFLFLDSPYYHYWRANSHSITSGFNPNLINQWIYLFNYIEKFLKEKNLNNDFYVALNNRICLSTLGLGFNAISKDNQLSPFRKIKKINLFLKHEKIINSFKQLELSRFPIVWRVFYFCAKFRFAAGFYLLLICIEYLRKSIR